MRDQQKKIAVINDFSGFGRCSLTVSLPIISAMKIQCCPLPTAVFSNHTGYESFYVADFTAHMAPYVDEWKKLGLAFNGILTGFLGSPQQIDIVKSFLEEFGAENTVTVVDPVMGDNGKLYSAYSSELACRMSSLLPYAHILTPNLTEACILSKVPYNPDMDDAGLQTICEKISAAGPKKIVISGLERGDDLENYVYEQGKVPVVIRAHKVGPCRAGTGDVFSSIIAADSVNGCSLEDSVRHASAFVEKCMRRTLEWNLPSADGVCFEEFLDQL